MSFNSFLPEGRPGGECGAGSYRIFPSRGRGSERAGIGEALGIELADTAAGRRRS